MGETSWWEHTKEGTPLLLAFVKVVWDVPPDGASQQRSRFMSGVEYVARSLDAAQPLTWSGNEVVLTLHAREPHTLVTAALSAAESIRERAIVDLGMTVRVAVHAASARWTSEQEKRAPEDVARCEYLVRVVPPQGIALTDDAYLALTDAERDRFALLGTWNHGDEAAYVFPASLAPIAEAGALLLLKDARLWRAFRSYVESPDVRRLRYVGFPLQKKHPPSLDVREVFVPPEVRRVSDRISEMGWAEAAWKREALFLPREPLARLVRNHRALVVLGDPGAGKTTALRWLAVLAAKGPLTWSAIFGTEELLLPLLVSVGRLTQLRSQLGEDCSVSQALAAYFEERGVANAAELMPFLRRILSQGKGLLLLDGLDEVRSEARQGVMRWLEAFCILHPRNRFIVSARWVGYSGFALPEGVEVEFSEFQDEQIRQYVQAFESACRRWENDGTPDDLGAQRTATQLLDALFANSRLRELARNPFMLSALALIHRAEGRLPRHRVQAYEILAWTLCETWGQARRVVANAAASRDIRYEEEAVPILGQLALRLHQQWPSGVAPEEFIIETLARAIQERSGERGPDAVHAARAFLERAGREVQILIERGAGQWGFLHLTFQEFFTAVGLLSAEEFESVAFEHLFRPRWEEVIRLGVGYMALIQKRASATQRFIRRVLTHPVQNVPEGKQVYLAALLASEAGDILPQSLQTEIARAVVEWNRSVPEAVALPLLRELALTEFSERVQDEVLNVLAASTPTGRESSILALGVLRSDRSRDTLRRMAREQDSEIRAQVATAIVKGGDPMDWETLRLLAGDLESRVRVAALAGFVDSRALHHRDESIAQLLDSAHASAQVSVIQTLSLLQSLSRQSLQTGGSQAVPAGIIQKAIHKGLSHPDPGVRDEALSLMPAGSSGLPDDAQARALKNGNPSARIPTASDARALHERVLGNDPSATLDVMRMFVRPLQRELQRTLFITSDDANDAVLDSMMSYLAHPDSYDPLRGSLSAFLSRMARHRAEEQLRAYAHRARGEQDAASARELWMSDPPTSLESTSKVLRLQELLKEQKVLGEQDRRLLQLLLSGVRAPEELARELGLTASSRDETRRQVKRHQDQLMRKLKRLVKEDDDLN